MAKSLVIVESPAKAKTISKILGKDYVVEASIGHIRDLPKNKDEIPDTLKKEKWTRLGVNIAQNFEPLYVVSAEKKDHVHMLQNLLHKADNLYLATDEDREGESIAWHLLEVLQPKVPVKRLVFHEITPKAIQHALSNVRDIKNNLVQAQEVRRVVDRLYGYQVSPLLQNTLHNRNLSAGRVQSVALRLVVEKERERLAFVSANWWSVDATLTAKTGVFGAKLHSWDGQNIANGASFTDKGQVHKSVLVLDEAKATEIAESLQFANVQVIEKKNTTFTEHPKPPFITSTLQQEAIRKLRWTAKRTMSIAQRLYENGWITYMRTDSTNLSDQAITAARNLISTTYGAEYIPNKPVQYSSAKGAQEAHEAIRPAGEVFKTISEARANLDDAEAKLYELIWKRTVSSQMNPATGERLMAKFAAGKAVLTASGKTYTFAGFRLAYIEGADDDVHERENEGEHLLPFFSQNEMLPVADTFIDDHTTKPPARFTEASLVKTLESYRIGRPSTYATIIDNILSRAYVFHKGSALAPSFRGMIVTQVLEQNMSWLVDYGFTSNMEEELDRVAIGELDRLDCLQEFYFGKKGLEITLEKAEKSIKDSHTNYVLPFQLDNQSVFVDFNQYGEFIRKGEDRIYLNESLAPDELSLTKLQELIANYHPGPLLLGVDPVSNLNMYIKTGRYGDYLQLGEDPAEGSKEKPRQISLLRGMTRDSVSVDEGIFLVSLPKKLGSTEHNGEQVDVVLHNGRYGMYLLMGKVSASIPVQTDVCNLTLAEALEIFANSSKKSGELLQLGQDADGNSVVIKSGKFGPYVTNGKFNASLGKRALEDVTLDVALELLEVAKTKEPKKKTKGKTGKTTKTTKTTAEAKNSKTSTTKTKKSDTSEKAKDTVKKSSKKKSVSKKESEKAETTVKKTAKKTAKKTTKKAPTKKAPTKKVTGDTDTSVETTKAKTAKPKATKAKTTKAKTTKTASKKK